MKTKSDVKRMSLLPLVGQVVEGTALFSHVAKREWCTSILLLNVKIDGMEFDHIRVAIPKDRYIKKIKEVKFTAKVHRYAK
jgi:hypothetical protein